MLLPRIKTKSTIMTAMILFFVVAFAPTGVAFADTCGGDKNTQVKTSIDIGCVAQGNPIMDMLFAITRFLSAGVGLVLVGSLIYAGIQYSASQDDPNAVAQAIKRIKSVLGALLLFVFAYALLNYIVPGMVLK